MADAISTAITATKSRYQDLLKRDVATALGQFRDLHCGTENYVFNDGRRALAITLSGTIPVNYKGGTYNIPVCLYLMDTHPYNPPMCYVRPTAEMVVKASQHVDTSGRIYLPYLHQWKYPESDLSGLLQIMTIVFGENCPVFSRAASQAASQQQSQYPGYPPYPPAGGVTGYMPQPQPVVSSASGYQPYGSAGGQRQSWYPASSGYNSAPYPTGVGYPSYTSTPSSTATPYPPYPPTAQSTATGAAAPVYNTIQPEHIRASLLSAVQEKLSHKLREAVGTAHAELQSIKKVREDLNSGEQKIKTMMNKIQQEQMDMETAMIVYQERAEEMKKILATATEREELSIDDAVDTTAPLYRQLLTAYIEDNALEDCIYHLCQALKRNKMDLDSFLKCIRTLSRQQFQIRAIMLRCRRVAGLDP